MTKSNNFTFLPPSGSIRASTALLAALAFLLPSPAWSQWTGGPTGPIYYNGGNVGIGTTAPDYRLVVNSGYGGGVIRIGAEGDWLNRIKADTHLALQTVVGADILFLTGGPFERMRVTNGGNVGIGTTNPGTYKLAVEGTIGARDIMVTSSPWSDYVFRPGYRLRPLSEVGAYIETHHHLPDIPSESEVREKGVSVGEMQAKLLAKIEELTLHMIQADQRNNRVEKQNQELRDRIAKLEAGSPR